MTYMAHAFCFFFSWQKCLYGHFKDKYKVDTEPRSMHAHITSLVRLMHPKEEASPSCCAVPLIYPNHPFCSHLTAAALDLFHTYPPLGFAGKQTHSICLPFLPPRFGQQTRTWCLVPSSPPAPAGWTPACNPTLLILPFPDNEHCTVWD